MTVPTNTLQKMEPGALVQLFVLDATSVGGAVVRFHQYTKEGNIYWQGNTYTPWPFEIEGFVKTSDQPPTPKLTIANIESSISALCAAYDDLLGCKITRVRTMAAFLDADSFLGGNMILNGEFETGLEYWTVPNPAKATWSSGVKKMSLASMTGAEAASYTLTNLTVGQTYRIVFTNDTNTLTFSAGHTTGSEYQAAASQAIGTHTFNFTAASATLKLTFLNTSATASFLDNVSVRPNPGNPSADPTQEFPQEIWYIERKSSESNMAVQFELVSALELAGVQLPRRQIIANYCSFLSNGGYRGALCGYTGAPVATADGTPTTVLALDKCGGKLSDCQLRQWPDNVLNFGGFPAAGLIRG